MMDDFTPDERAAIPGAMEEVRTRTLPDGTLLEFETAPAGWLTKAGTPRLVPWRAYFATPPDGKRTRLTSVSTLLDGILPKGGLPTWSEARGIEGAVQALQQGVIDTTTAPEAAVDIVRRAKLGADAARDDAAERGTETHKPLEVYMRTGSPPSLADVPAERRGFIQALTRWLLKTNPEPVAVEHLVANPDDGYAGRLDLRAFIGGRLLTVDAKTNDDCKIYPHAHLQVNLYERAAVRSGDVPADGLLVVVFGADGSYREMPADHDQWRIDAALSFHRALKPITSVCESANRKERQAREAVAA